MEEIQKLEESLRTGTVPSEFQVGGQANGQQAHGDAEMADAEPAADQGNGDKPEEMAVG